MAVTWYEPGSARLEYRVYDRGFVEEVLSDMGAGTAIDELGGMEAFDEAFAESNAALQLEELANETLDGASIEAVEMALQSLLRRRRGVQSDH